MYVTLWLLSRRLNPVMRLYQVNKVEDFQLGWREGRKKERFGYLRMGPDLMSHADKNSTQ